MPCSVGASVSRSRSGRPWAASPRADSGRSRQTSKRMDLLSPLRMGALTAPNRVMFGPIVTNLGDDDRQLTARHTAFYQRRAAGGCGVIVVEGASVHDSDWPNERAPLAERCGPGWSAIARACHARGALVMASLDHAGGQGSSAYSQAPLWAPSRVPEVNAREVPKWMEERDIEAVIAGFVRAGALAVEAGCDGVELNAGQHSLVRQFLSGLTNHRADRWGTDRQALAREILTRLRATIGADHVLGLRLCGDELAPWAGITPEMAPGIAAELCAAGVDYVVMVRGSIYSAEQTRPDFHVPTGFNIELTRAVRAALDVPVWLQGSVVDPAQAQWALDHDVCDGVEMTRAQLADPDLVSKVAAGDPAGVRPCIRCNQTCQVRDPRNPIITCVAEPSTGHETEDPDWTTPAPQRRRVLVMGGGPAGLEAARVAASLGHRVRLVEREQSLGGLAGVAGPGRALTDWLAAQCRLGGVEIWTDSVATPEPDEVVIECTGSQPGVRPYDIAADALVIDIADVARGLASVPLEGPVVVVDPIGGPIGVAAAETLGARAHLVTPDHIAGNELSRTGDLAPANVRLARAGVNIERRSLVREVHRDHVVLEDRFGGGRRRVDAVAVVDCGFRLPQDPVVEGALRAGDAVAPRTILEAILEARRAARALDRVGPPPVSAGS